MLTMLWLVLNTQEFIVVHDYTLVLMGVVWFFFDMGTIIKIWELMDRCKNSCKGKLEG